MQSVKKYKLVLETKSPFRIGGKKDPFSALDQPIVRIGDQVVVPGTTLKGAAREEIEQYLIRAYPDEAEMKPCIPSSDRMLSLDERKLITDKMYKGSSCHYPCDPKKCDHETTKLGHYICPACYLLGAQGLVGFVTIPFLYADTASSEVPATRIDRVTRTVAEGTHRFYQMIPVGAKFEGTLTIILEDKIKKWNLGKPRPLQGHTQGDLWLKHGEWNMSKILKELIEDRISSITRLGGQKSSGAGEVSIAIQGI